jgi:MscS family membrane protein
MIHDFLARPLLDNTVGSYLWPVIIVLLAVFFKNHLSRFLVSYAYKLVGRWAPGIQKADFVRLLLKPLGLFLVFLIFVAAIDHLAFPRFLDFKIHFLRTDLASLLGGIKIILLTVLFFWVLLRLVDFIALVLGEKVYVAHAPSEYHIIAFFRDFIKIILGFIAFIIIMKFLVGKDWTSKLVGALGIGAAALALAAKETIENLIGSFIIILDRPFRIGDYVKVGDMSGTVEKVGLRSTRLRSDDKTYVTIPNRQVADSILNDITLMTQRRAVQRIELDPATAADDVMHVLQDIQHLLQEDAEVLDNYTLNFNDISHDSLVIQLIYYTDVVEWQAFNRLRQRINIGMVQAFESRNVKLAARFNQNHN